jgi:hypothetical protein
MKDKYQYSYTHTFLPVTERGSFRLGDSNIPDPYIATNLPWNEFMKLAESGALSEQEIEELEGRYVECYIYSKTIPLDKKITSEDLNTEFVFNHFEQHPEDITEDLFVVKSGLLDIGTGAIRLPVKDKVAKVFVNNDTTLFDRSVIVIIVENLPYSDETRCSDQIRKSLETYFYYYPLHGKGYSEFHSLPKWKAKKEFKRVETLKQERVETLKQILTENNITYSPLQDYSQIETWIQQNIYSIAYRHEDMFEANLVPDAAWLSLLFDIGLLIEQDLMEANPNLTSYLNTTNNASSDYNHRMITGFSHAPTNFSIDIPELMVTKFGFNLLNGDLNDETLNDIIHQLRNML